MRLTPAILLPLAIGIASAAEPAAQPAATFDAALAKRLGADERGMRMYVLVVLRSGPTPVQGEAARKAMFEGHIANIGRLAKEGKLALAGPFEKNDANWRGRTFTLVDTGGWEPDAQGLQAQVSEQAEIAASACA